MNAIEEINDEDDEDGEDGEDDEGSFFVQFGNGTIGLKLEKNANGEILVTDIAKGSNADLNGRIEVTDVLLNVGGTCTYNMRVNGNAGVLSLIAKSSRPVAFKFKKMNRSTSTTLTLDQERKKKKKKKKKKEKEKEKKITKTLSDLGISKFKNVRIGRRVFARSRNDNGGGSRAVEWKYGEVVGVNEVRGIFDVDFDDGKHLGGLSTEHIRVTLTGATRGKAEEDYHLLSSFVGTSRGRREEEEQTGMMIDEDDGLTVSYGLTQKRVTMDDYDPSNW